MKPFTIDPQLQSDCIVIGKLKLCHLLLMNHSLVPWFILVPPSDKIEIYELDKNTQLQLLEEINLLSTFVKAHFQTDKLNVAAIGNIVRQLHVHVIGRNFSDTYWPNVVWGHPEKIPYAQNEIEGIKKMLSKTLTTLNLIS